jgi:hypothetical protein
VAKGRIVEWTEEMDLKVRKMWPNRSRSEICKLLGVTGPSLYRRAKALGLDIKQERASMGGKASTGNMCDIRATREFEKAYRTAAKRNGWLSVTNYRGYAG